MIDYISHHYTDISRDCQEDVHKMNGSENNLSCHHSHYTENKIIFPQDLTCIFMENYVPLDDQNKSKIDGWNYLSVSCDESL